MNIIHGFTYSDVLSSLDKNEISIKIIDNLDNLFNELSVIGYRNEKKYKIIPAHYLEDMLVLLHLKDKINKDKLDKYNKEYRIYETWVPTK